MEWINHWFLLCFPGKFTLFSAVMQPWSELNFSKIKPAEPARLASGLLCSVEFGVHVLLAVSSSCVSAKDRWLSREYRGGNVRWENPGPVTGVVAAES